MSEYFDNEKLTELEKDIKTIPVDGEGRTLAVDYDEHFVRNNIIKLIADLRLSREEAAKQKFRFEYTEDLVKKAHAERDSLITTIESQKEEIEKQKARATEYLNSKIDTANAKHMLDTKNKKLQTEIESLKAITELAVNELRWYAESNIKDIFDDMGDKARTTLSEIERLQNG